MHAFEGDEGRARKMHGFLLPTQHVSLEARRATPELLCGSCLSHIHSDKPAYKNR